MTYSRAQIAEALEAAAVVLTLHGAAYAPIFARLERALAEADSAQASAETLRARAAAIAARAPAPRAKGGRHAAQL